MKKKFVVLLSSLIFLVSVSVYVFANTERIYSGFISFPMDVEPVITHTLIETVSSIEKILNAKISVDFGSYVSAKAKIIYYKNGDPSSKQEEPSSDGKQIQDNTEFFIALPQFVDDDTSVNYQIQIELKDSNDNIVYRYFPSETEFNVANITNSTTTFVSANDGGKVVFESGNQEYKNTELTVPSNAINNDSNITLTQVSKESEPRSREIVTIYKIEADNTDTEITTPLSLELYYGVDTPREKFNLMYRENETSDWKKVSISQTDLANKTILANITKFGEYAIFINENLNDNDYRPTKRVKVKSRISTYGGFKFTNLQEGDSVKIYTVNGKKIRTIECTDSKGYVEWNGRRDDGDWAESGTYIYQIKLKYRGKVVSGTIAFVW